MLPIDAKSSAAGPQTRPAPKIKTFFASYFSSMIVSWNSPTFKDMLFSLSRDPKELLELAREVKESTILSKTALSSAPTCPR